MQKRTLTLLALSAALCLLFTACGGGGSYNRADNNTAAKESVSPEAPSADFDYNSPEEIALADEGSASITAPQDDRMVIMTANLRMETLEFTQTCNAIQTAVVSAGGYISGTDINNSQSAGSSRYANFTLRIPADKYPAFMQSMEATGNVTSRDESSEDVTSQYVDIESRLKSLRTQEEWLLEKMADATKMADMIELQSRLAEIQYSIESYTSSQRTMKDLTTYSTVYVYVREVKEITEPVPEKYSARAAATFRKSWRSFGTFMQELGLVLIAALPIIVFAAFAVLIALVVHVFVKRYRAKNPKPQKPAKAAPMPPNFSPAYGMPGMAPMPPVQAPAPPPAAPKPQAGKEPESTEKGAKDTKK